MLLQLLYGSYHIYNTSRCCFQHHVSLSSRFLKKDTEPRSRYRMYFIYMALCIIAAIFIYHFVPETKKLPVEELGALFGDEVVVHLTDDGRGIVEEKQRESADEIAGDDTRDTRKGGATVNHTTEDVVVTEHNL